MLVMQAELAAQLLEEEWPDEDEVRAARMAVREEATPVPERAWALRNVASTLALGGPGERARARSLLEKAVSLKEQWLDDKEHPGVVALCQTHIVTKMTMTTVCKLQSLVLLTTIRVVGNTSCVIMLNAFPDGTYTMQVSSLQTA